MQTIAYKNGFIHIRFVDYNGSGLGLTKEVIRVQVDKYAYSIEVKSIHQAKLLITNHAKKYGSISGK